MIGQVMSILQAIEIIDINTNLLMLESFSTLRSNNDILKAHHCLEKKLIYYFLWEFSDICINFKNPKLSHVSGR
jgi:hypothetical protein